MILFKLARGQEKETRVENRCISFTPEVVFGREKTHRLVTLSIMIYRMVAGAGIVGLQPNRYNASQSGGSAGASPSRLQSPEIHD